MMFGGQAVRAIVVCKQLLAFFTTARWRPVSYRRTRIWLGRSYPAARVNTTNFCN